MYGRMNHRIELLGTSLALQSRQRVELTYASNLPDTGLGCGWFARPADGQWSDGIARGPDDSIHLTADDFTFEESAKPIHPGINSVEYGAIMGGFDFDLDQAMAD